jgi:chemotaxis protein MotB
MIDNRDRHVKTDEPYDIERVVKRRRRLGCAGWLLFVLVAGLGAAFVRYMYLPLRKQSSDASAKLDEAEAKTKELDARLAEARRAESKLQNERDALSAERQKALDEKERALRELEQLKGDLTSNLEAEVKSGDIGIQRRGRDLVVDLTDKVLFDVGKAEINERGKSVLGHVVTALAKFDKRVIQVGGHTDNQPVTSPNVQQQFPTNWELSTARATNVVRFLQESGKIPGERLMAAGFAQYRPIASNANEAERRRNRRIEIVLLPPETPPAP